MRKWLLIGLLAAVAHADPPPIALPTHPPDEPQAGAAAPEPMSEVIPDKNDKEWQDYTNRIVKAHVRVRTSWTVIEIKETKDSGSVSFRLTRVPFVTFSITREPMTGSFEEYVSSPTLTSIYPSGFKKGRGTLAGRQAVLVKGMGSDGRLDESYFVANGTFYTQVSFTAPQESWKQSEPSFTGIKESFRWLP